MLVIRKMFGYLAANSAIFDELTDSFIEPPNCGCFIRACSNFPTNQVGFALRRILPSTSSIITVLGYGTRRCINTDGSTLLLAPYNPSLAPDMMSASEELELVGIWPPASGASLSSSCKRRITSFAEGFLAICVMSLMTDLTTISAFQKLDGSSVGMIVVTRSF